MIYCHCYRVLADGHIPWACEAFSEFHGKELVQTPALFWYCSFIVSYFLYNHFPIRFYPGFLFFTLLYMQMFELINPLYLAYLYKLLGTIFPLLQEEGILKTMHWKWQHESSFLPSWVPYSKISFFCEQ